MALKILKNNFESGFSFFEIILGVSILSIIAIFVLMIINPLESQAKARDERRIADINYIDGAILEFVIDNGTYPSASSDTSSVIVRYSNILPSGGSFLTSAVSGWLSADVSDYISKLPVDPTNNVTYRYVYANNSQSYELNANLEQFQDVETADGGSDNDLYEVGSNLNLR